MIADLEDSYKILPPTANGMLYRHGHFVPEFTVTKNPQFATHYGFIKENNKPKISSSFLKATTWGDYCSKVHSAAYCSSGDDTAVRNPQTKQEEESFFIDGLYNGYFRNTTDSFCDEDNQGCYGHFIDSECSSRTRSEAQMYWNDIPMKSRGPGSVNGGYSPQQTIQIWQAANKTKSDVMVVWESPSYVIANFADSDASWFRVQFPESTEECVDYQRNNTLKCTTNETERVGDDPLASCDYPIERPIKVISSILKTIYDSSPDAKRSPALDFMNTFKVEIHVMQEILNEMYRIQKVDFMNAEREAVCKWVYDHLESIELSVPKGYPREIIRQFNNQLVIAAIIITGFTMFFICIVIVLIYKYRNKRPIRYAQVPFLAWIMIGKQVLLIKV